ncbi:toprim domain-containing protein [Muribaculaceae bacterium Isolate-037 (Harlan)]|nr:toprim domain-containing protein [Muribaculaceae bacterium Isolate-037 (Harlan)]
MKSYSDFGIDIPYGRNSGKIKMICPKCHEQRKNKRDKSLSVDLDKGVWHCHYCSWSGTIHVGERSHDAPKKEYRRPTPRPITTLSRKLVDWFNSRGISESTLKKMKINEGEHFMPQKGKKMNTVQFNYYLNGELINVKYRTGQKDFMLESGAELIPYNLDAITGESECIITEGEMDCLSFVEIGKANCISVPNGANSNLSYLDDFIDGWFEDKETIDIATDTDTKGLQLRDELIRRFGAERCRVITYGDDCKDANEHLQKYGKESLEKCLRDAKEVKVDGVFSLNDYEEELDSIYKNGLKKGFLVGHPNLDALISFETKRLAIVTGIPGSGKSEFIDEMCVRLNILYDFKVGFFSPENMPMEYHAVKLIEKLCGKKLQAYSNSDENITLDQYSNAKSYYRDNFFHVMPEDGYTIDNILAKAKYLVRRRGIRIFVLDPFNRIEHEQSSRESETQYISRVLDRMSSFAIQNDILFVLMAHPTKVRKDNGNGGIPTMYDINGSANFFNKADYGIIVHRERDESKNYTLVRVEKVKFRHLGQPGDATFKFNVINGRYIPWKQSDGIVVNFKADMVDMIKQKQNDEITIPQTQIELPWNNLPSSPPLTPFSQTTYNPDPDFPFGPTDPDEPLPF